MAAAFSLRDCFSNPGMPPAASVDAHLTAA